MPSRSVPLLIIVLALAATALHAGGCATLGLRKPSGSLVARSADGAKELAPVYTTAVHVPTDVAVAEVYLSDLPLDRLLDAKDHLHGLSGSLVQIRLFIVPRAGNTPIGDTACNITIRHYVLSSSGDGMNPEIGVYGGGGFLYPSGNIDSSSISGSMDEVTLRLLESTPGFIDLLGAAEASGGFTTKQDARTARGLAARAQRLMFAIERQSAVK